jgi:hypothetical protein
MALLLGMGQCVAYTIESMNLDWALRGLGLWARSGKRLVVEVELQSFTCSEPLPDH